MENWRGSEEGELEGWSKFKQMSTSLWKSSRCLGQFGREKTLRISHQSELEFLIILYDINNYNLQCFLNSYLLSIYILSSTLPVSSAIYSRTFPPSIPLLHSTKVWPLPSSLISVFVFGRIVLGRNNEPLAFAGPLVDYLTNINEFLWVLEHPGDFVIVARACVDHDVLVSVEEHEGHGVVKLVHGVEVGHLGDVDQIEDYELAQLVGHLQYDFVYLHALRVPVVAEPDDHKFVSFVNDGLVHFPAVVQVGQDIGHLQQTALLIQIIIIILFSIMKAIEVRLVGRFRFERKLPGDHEHILYLGIHTQNESYVFLKGDEIKKKNSPNRLSILQEGKILQSMQGGIGIPHMHWCGQEEDYFFIVLEELSLDMSKLLKKCGGKFSLKTTLLVGIELISILQYYHFKNFLHCGLRPEHIMIGAGSKYTKIFLVDYSTSIRFRDNQTLEHISEEQKKGDERFYNMQFSSPAYQRGETPSRKDEIVSFLYLMAYLQRGQLPWSKLMGEKMTEKERAHAVLEMKMSMTGKQIFEGCLDLATLYESTINLKFDQKPRYSYYKNVFRQRLEREGQIEDGIYDWMLLGDEDDELVENLCLDLEIIPNETEFLAKLEEEIRARDKSEAQKLSLGKGKQPKKVAGTNAGKEKECQIF